MDLFRLTVTVVADVSIAGMAFTVLMRNRRQAANRAFAATSIMIAAWLTLAFLSDQTALVDVAVLLNRLTMASSLLMGVCLFYFVSVFPRATDRPIWGSRVFMGGGVVLAGVTALTPWIVEGVVFEAWGTSIANGPLMGLYSAWLLTGSLLLGTGLVLGYRRANERERTQLKLLFIGLTLFVVISLVFGLVVPLATGSWEYSTLSVFGALILMGFATYAMVKHRFMDIRMVVLRGVAYAGVVAAVGALLAVAALISRTEAISRLQIPPDAAYVVVSLTAILLFQPIKRGLERTTDGVFHRTTYHPQSLLAELGTMLASTLDLKEMEDRLSRELCAGMRLERVVIVHFRGDDVEVVGAPREFVSGGMLPLLVNRHYGTLVFSDDPLTDSALRAVLEASRIRALVPLIGDDMDSGVILLGPKLSGEMFSAQDELFLENLGRAATISFRNASLFEERNRRVRELSSLSALAWALGGDSHFDAILAGALHEVMNVTDADAGSIMLLEPDGETLTIKCASGLSQEIITAARQKVGEGIAGWVAENKRPLVLGDVNGDSFGGEMKRSGIQSALCVPLMRNARVIGVLNVSKLEETTPFSQENLEVTESFAGQLAIAIENARLAVDVDVMSDSLQQKRREFAESQDFFAKASHELRTPLNSIIGFGTILGNGMAGPLNAEQQRQADMILASGKRLLALVNDLLDIEKLSSESHALEIGPCDLSELMVICAGVMEPLAAEKGLQLIAERSAIPPIQADTRRIEQSLLNLLSNAIKFTEHGFVRMRLIPQDGFVVIDVSDSGRGISDDLLPHVFSEFVSGTGGTNGTGLGLSIVRQVAQRHGGRVTVKSQVGVGTRFEIWLPTDSAASIGTEADPLPDRSDEGSDRAS